jgi:hypothetical protein
VKEVLDHVYHWTGFHERIRQDVSSHWVESAAALIDPMVPEEGIEWFESRLKPQRIILSNRHHYRHSAQFVEAFDVPVLCPRPGLHEFEGDTTVDGYGFGEPLAAGITAIEVGAICPDDAALELDTGDGALLFADGLINYGGLRFVPDELMGDDPEAVKNGLRESLSGLLDRRFDNLLFAHGEPMIGGGKTALREFLDETEPTL